MKKAILFMAVALSAATVSAQESFKPAAGDVSIEVGFNPLSTTNEVITLPSQSLKAYYSLSDQLSVRLGLGFKSVSKKAVIRDYGPSSEGRDYERSESTFSIAPGIVYSFWGTEKLTPYVGAEIVFASTSNEIKEDGNTNTNVPDEDALENYDGTLTPLVPSTTFGVNVFTGFNYYLAKNLYIGAEVALGYVSTSLKDVETGNVSVDPKTSMGAFGISATPSLRLGWTF